MIDIIFEAKFAGTCPDCEENVEVGQQLRWWDGPTREAVHVDCDAVAPAERVEVTCPTCWLIKPCECDS